MGLKHTAIRPSKSGAAIYVHCTCVSAGTDFTLEKLVEIGLDQHAELVGDISSAASKELAIEQVQ